MIDSKREMGEECVRSVSGVRERLEEYPELEGLFEEYLDIVENANGDVVRAGEAEEEMVKVVRRMGQKGLHAWAERKERKVEAESDKQTDLSRKEKKSSDGTRFFGR